VPYAEHVAVLWAATGLREAVEWLDASFDRDSAVDVPVLGWGIVLMLTGAVMLAQPLAMRLPAGGRPEVLPRRAFWGLVLGTMGVVPAIATSIEVGALPVLVADYLAVHLALYGGIILFGAWVSGWRVSLRGWQWGLVLAVFALGLFGLLLDRYVASFFPHLGRVVIILAMLHGAILAMWADAVLTQATAAPVWRRVVVRGAFLISLGIAVAVDFDRLFFLVLRFAVRLVFCGGFGLLGR